MPALPLRLPTIIGLLLIPNLKKKRKEKEIAEEGEVVPQKEHKWQKTTKDKGQASSVKSKEAEHSANVHHPTWNPQLELDGAVVP